MMEEIPPPPLALTMAEPWRSVSEFAALCFSSPMLMTAPRGDGHSVLVLPGLAASDLSTALLRSYLQFLGYRAEVWALGMNVGYRTLGIAEERLRNRVAEISAAADDEKISLVGWSLGGVMARHMARDHPELVRQVVTLGAPFTGDPRATNIREFFEYVTGEDFDLPATRMAWEANSLPPSVPTTSIYSKTDGITSWRNCLEVESDTANNVEVFGSHLGLVHNPMALYAMAQWLAQH